jgi:hypothetical protein
MMFFLVRNIFYHILMPFQGFIGYFIATPGCTRCYYLIALSGFYLLVHHINNIIQFVQNYKIPVRHCLARMVSIKINACIKFPSLIKDRQTISPQSRLIVCLSRLLSGGWLSPARLALNFKFSPLAKTVFCAPPEGRVKFHSAFSIPNSAFTLRTDGLPVPIAIGRVVEPPQAKCQLSVQEALFKVPSLCRFSGSHPQTFPNALYRGK